MCWSDSSSQSVRRPTGECFWLCPPLKIKGRLQRGRRPSTARMHRAGLGQQCRKGVGVQRQVVPDGTVRCRHVLVEVGPFPLQAAAGRGQPFVQVETVHDQMGHGCRREFLPVAVVPPGEEPLQRMPSVVVQGVAQFVGQRQGVFPGARPFVHMDEVAVACPASPASAEVAAATVRTLLPDGDPLPDGTGGQGRQELDEVLRLRQPVAGPTGEDPMPCTGTDGWLPPWP